MRLTKTDVYTLQLLGYLAHQKRPGWVSGKELGDAVKISRPYMARVLAQLSSSGIVSSKRGAGGGYALARDASTITLLDVLTVVGGPVSPLACTKRVKSQTCPEAERCTARSRAWTRVSHALAKVLASVTVADLATDFRQGVDYGLCLHHLLRPNSAAHSSTIRPNR